MADLSWTDIDELRRHRDLRYLRDVLADVEEAARSEDSANSEVVQRIHREYEDRLREANARLRTGLGGRLLTALVGLAVGQVAGPLAGLPLAGELVGAAAGWLADGVLSARREPRWLVADTAVRKMIDTKALDASL